MLNLKHLIDTHNSVSLAHLHSRWNASRWHWRLEDNQLYWKDVKPLRHWKWWDGAYGLVLDELKRNWAREETLAKRTSQFLIHHHNIFSQCSLRYIPSEQTIQCICYLPDIINSCIDTSRISHVVIIVRRELLDTQRCALHEHQLRQHITGCERCRVSTLLSQYVYNTTQPSRSSVLKNKTQLRNKTPRCKWTDIFFWQRRIPVCLLTSFLQDPSTCLWKSGCVLTSQLTGRNASSPVSHEQPTLLAYIKYKGWFPYLAVRILWLLFRVKSVIFYR